MSTASMGNDMRGIDYFRLPSLRNMGFLCGLRSDGLLQIACLAIEEEVQ